MALCFPCLFNLHDIRAVEIWDSLLRVTICRFWYTLMTFFFFIEFLITNNNNKNNNKRIFENENKISCCRSNWIKRYLKQNIHNLAIQSVWKVGVKSKLIIHPIKVFEENNNNNYEIRESQVELARHTYIRQSYEPRTSVSINVTNGDADDRCQPSSPLLSIRYTIYFFTPVIWQRYNWIVSSLFISVFVCNVFIYMYRNLHT